MPLGGFVVVVTRGSTGRLWGWKVASVLTYASMTSWGKLSGTSLDVNVSMMGGLVVVVAVVVLGIKTSIASQPPQFATDPLHVSPLGSGSGGICSRLLVLVLARPSLKVR